MTIVTCVTAQSQHGVTASESVTGAGIRSQWQSVWQTSPPDAIKIGATGMREAVIAQLLEGVKVPVVYDPVTAATRGGQPLGVYSQALADLATVVTPNALEKDAVIAGGGAQGTVITKGGHAPIPGVDTLSCGTDSIDLVLPPVTTELGGTGCRFASALATRLACSDDIKSAAVYAKMHVYQALLGTEGRQLLPTVGHEAWSPSPPMERRIGLYPIFSRAAQIVEMYCGKFDVVQLRIKDLSGSELEAEVVAASRFARDHNLRLFINDFVDLAIVHGAYGVHLGQEDLATTDIKAVKGAGLHLGISTHSYYEAAVAKTYQPSYVALGPIFPTTCKSMKFGPQGLARIQEWVRMFGDTPVVAIGGLKPEHADEVWRSGADGLAFISSAADFLGSD